MPYHSTVWHLPRCNNKPQLSDSSFYGYSLPFCIIWWAASKYGPLLPGMLLIFRHPRQTSGLTLHFPGWALPLRNGDAQWWWWKSRKKCVPPYKWPIKPSASKDVMTYPVFFVRFTHSKASPLGFVKLFFSVSFPSLTDGHEGRLKDATRGRKSFLFHHVRHNGGKRFYRRALCTFTVAVAAGHVDWVCCSIFIDWLGQWGCWWLAS